MLCKNCGADIGNKGKCEYCDTVYFEEFQNQTIQKGEKDLPPEKTTTKGNSGKLTFLTKIVLVFWLICCIFKIPEIKNLGIIEYISVSLFGFAFFGGIAQLISTGNKKQLQTNKQKSIPQQEISDTVSVNKPYDQMDGHEFELFCGEILKKSGFTGISITKSVGDQGIDILAFKGGMKYGIQCKCHSDNIGIAAVQEAFSGKSFYSCHVVAVLTNRYFTKSAQALAEKNGVLLWDRDRLDTFIALHK